MKISPANRCSSASCSSSEPKVAGRRRLPVAALLACLVLAPGSLAGQLGPPPVIVPPASGPQIPIAVIAQQLADGVARVQKRFAEERKKILEMAGPAGEPTLPREKLTNLIAGTAKDLDEAIKNVGEPGLDALRDWAVAELERIQSQVGPAPANAWLRAPPYPIARVASLAPFSWRSPGARSEGARDAEGPTLDWQYLTREVAIGVLDDVGRVLETIFVLADHNVLQVEVDVLIAPKQAEAMIFPRSKLGVKNSRTQLSKPRLRLWRGLYLWDLYASERDAEKADSCPRNGEQDRCWMDFVHDSGRIVCCLPSAIGKPATPCGCEGESGCHILKEDCRGPKSPRHAP